jgi:hypothetical protein
MGVSFVKESSRAVSMARRAEIERILGSGQQFDNDFMERIDAVRQEL